VQAVVGWGGVEMTAARAAIVLAGEVIMAVSGVMVLVGRAVGFAVGLTVVMIWTMKSRSDPSECRSATVFPDIRNNGGYGGKGVSDARRFET